MNKWISFVAAVITFFLFINVAHACNPKAMVHQQKLRQIMMALDDFGVIPSVADEKFVLCMLSQKEDRQAFEQRIRQLKAARLAQQQRAAERRRQAIIAHNRPQSPQELARAKSYCRNLVREGGVERKAGIKFCMAAWKANPHSRCTAGNLPCGSEMNAPCYNPYAGQQCVNGRVTNSGTMNVPQWVTALPFQVTKLSDGVYTDVGLACRRPGQPGVIVIQNRHAQFYDPFGSNTYSLKNTRQKGVLDAINNGTGDNGYNGQIIVSGSTFRWSGYGVDAPRPFRLCQVLFGIALANVPDRAIVTAVEKGSVAEKAGVQPKDIIVSFDGRPVATPQSLVADVHSIKGGVSIPIEIVRNGQKIKVVASF